MASSTSAPGRRSRPRRKARRVERLLTRYPRAKRLRAESSPEGTSVSRWSETPTRGLNARSRERTRVLPRSNDQRRAKRQDRKTTHAKRADRAPEANPTTRATTDHDRGRSAQGPQGATPHAPARRAAHGACARKNGDRATPGTPDSDRRGHQGPTLWRRPQNEREERRRGHHRQGYSQRDAHPQGADEEGDEGGALLPSRGLAATAHITDDEATTVPTRGRNRAGIACRPRADGTNVAARDRTQDNRAQAAHSIETPQ